MVLTTSASSTWNLRLKCGNAIKSAFLDGTFKQLGIKKRPLQPCRAEAVFSEECTSLGGEVQFEEWSGLRGPDQDKFSKGENLRDWI